MPGKKYKTKDVLISRTLKNFKRYNIILFISWDFCLEKYGEWPGHQNPLNKSSILSGNKTLFSLTTILRWLILFREHEQ